MAKNLVIVESPAKAKTLKKFLGSNYKVEATVGHVRDLPKSTIGIDFENDYEPKYITIRGKGDILAKLRREVKKADNVYLATDPDREGEAISWHLQTALKLDDKNTKRVSFNEVTKNAVKKSLKEPREIDMNLVDAQQARRVLDRIVGYQISPLLWKKVKRRLSAGRVQSTALKLICDREEEIDDFIPVEYHTIHATLEADKKEFEANFSSVDSEKIEISTTEEADNIIEEILKNDFIVDEVKTGRRRRRPLPPFTTSTLQQDASRNLNFATNKTMMLAQQLYEGVDIKDIGTTGLVTYIRTDSVRISDDAFTQVNGYIKEKYGDEFATKEKNEYKSKGRAQDAHEAIRPTSVEITPSSIRESVSRDQYRLYRLIWERFVASQMTDAMYETLSISINSGKYNFSASGQTLIFEGFLSVYNTNSDSTDTAKDFPKLKEKQKLKTVKVEGVQHFTQAPPRFSEAILVRTLEELGIGRPSTYSSIITTLQKRNYVTKENNVFFTTELGEIVNEIMNENFEEIVDVDFTAKMESDLDKVEDGEIEWKEVIRDFYPEFKIQLEEADKNIEEVEIEDEVSDIMCEKCNVNMVVKYGRYGKFLACPNFPDCRNTKPYFEDAGVSCPECNGKILVKKTRKGRRYFGCENYPECEFMSWYKPMDEKCPKCGKHLIEKGRKANRKAVCSDSDNCNYSRPLEENEENQ